MMQFTFFSEKNKRWNTALAGILVAVILFGAGLRLYRITQEQFFFYDEGYYLNYNRPFLEEVADKTLRGLREWLKLGSYFLHFSLATGKALHFFIVDSRIFWGDVHDWFVPRVVSALAGILTVFGLFGFARRYYKSDSVGILAAAILAVMPSHVFYSRLAMQEALATLLFLGGFYFYLFPRRLGWRTFLSSLIFVLAFYSNYRLIILPVFTLLTEGLLCLSQKQRPDGRKWFWHTLIFIFVLMMVGSLYDGANIRITFTWMFYQAHLAKDTVVRVFNFLSFPYYLFRLEGFVFAALFFSSSYYFWRRQWQKAWPLALFCLFALNYSVAMEKGARYICVILPFLAMTVASLFLDGLQALNRRGKGVKIAVAVLVVLFSQLMLRSFIVAGFKTYHREAVAFLKSYDDGPKICSTQPYIHKLYVENMWDVIEAPHHYRGLVKSYAAGYRYLIVEPQAYISWTRSGERFDPPLIPYLEFILNKVRPMRVYPNFSRPMLERFAFEHNQDLRTTLRFLEQDTRSQQLLRVYAIRDCLETIQVYTRLNQRGKHE